MDRINADVLRTFLAVARHQHLGHAADALHADQSTVSRKIARLEGDIGVQLFERVGRGIRLNPAGERFATRAERLLRELRDAIDEAAGAASAESGEVRIGFLHTVGARWLPERLARFLAEHPAVHFVLQEAVSPAVVSGVVQGNFDVGILGPPPPNHPHVEVMPLFRERVAVVVPLGHRLVGQTSCTLHDLEAEPLILPRSRGGLRSVVDEAFAQQGVQELIAYEGDDFTIIESLVEAGLGVTLMPMPLPVPSSRVAVIPLREPPIARTMALIWDRRRPLPPAAGLFVRFLHDEVSAPFDPVAGVTAAREATEP